MVKAFNTLSAWALQNGPSDANRQVLNVCVCDVLFPITFVKKICLLVGKVYLIFAKILKVPNWVFFFYL